MIMNRHPAGLETLTERKLRTLRLWVCPGDSGGAAASSLPPRLNFRQLEANSLMSTGGIKLPFSPWCTCRAEGRRKD